MKRAMPWSDEDDDSSKDSSSSGSDDEGPRKTKGKDRANQSSKGKAGKNKNCTMSFEALKQHGFKGGLSVLGVPPPKEDAKQDWSWSTGKDKRETKQKEESHEERQKTRTALALGEQLAGVQTRKEKNLSFSQKEKRKRDLGQASRGKSYVEEEKRLLRESGIYSGFDT